MADLYFKALRTSVYTLHFITLYCDTCVVECEVRVTGVCAGSVVCWSLDSARTRRYRKVKLYIPVKYGSYTRGCVEHPAHTRAHTSHPHYVNTYSFVLFPIYW